MALTRFKFIKIVLDRADMTISQTITAKEGAVNGNGIELQLINGSLIEDTTGVAVYLNWKHQTAGNQGSEPFTLVDATTGTYRVSYPTEMLTGGLVDADIKIVDGSSITMTTQPLLIKVAKGATSSTVQSANAWNDIQTILVRQQELEATFNQAIAGLTIDSEVITARESSVKGITYATLDERLEAEEADTATKASKLFATNLVTNGDFSNGLNGWTFSFPSQFSVSDGKLVVNATATRTFNPTTPITIVSGRKYFVCIEVSDYVSGTVSLSSSSFTGQTVTLGSNAGRLSAVVTAVNTNNLIIALTNTAVLKIDNIIVMDITTMFGSGNEPTKEQMDWIFNERDRLGLGHLNGTQELLPMVSLLNFINTKANIAQEAWITPTLTNGWVDFDATGYETCAYFKDNFGIVHLKGMAKSGVIGTSTPIFILPTGHRPTKRLKFSIVSNGAFGSIDVLQSGAVTVQGGNNAFISLDNISFRVV